MTGWANRDPLNQYARPELPDRPELADLAGCRLLGSGARLAARGVRTAARQHRRRNRVDRGREPESRQGSDCSTRAELPSPARSRAGVCTPRTPGQHPLGSTASSKAWLDQGPLLLDGARWFGEGHWFVAVGYDQNGIYTRDSSGWDTRYLSWSRLYGEVGFSGWVVGVTR